MTTQTTPVSQNGRLRIFLAYAPGAGKREIMLREALACKQKGIDVVVGCLDIYRQSEELVAAGMEIIPHRTTEVRGQVYSEMDIDAILARRPQLVVVEDLAHVNAPHSRHARRYQDVLEILSAGIDVFTAVSIIHLESLKDIITQITGITISNTIPDYILENADEIKIIDIPVNDLIEKAKRGELNIPYWSPETIRAFYRAGNLTALREIAFRRAADFADVQLRTYMKEHAIAGPWPVGERILVCVSSSPLSDRLVRTARRLAQQLSAEWFVAYVETPEHLKLSAEDRERVSRTLQLAESLGAHAVRLNGRSVAETVVNYALAHNISKIVAGKPLQSRWRELLRGGSLIDEIVHLSHNLDVYVISGEPESERRNNMSRLLESQSPMRMHFLASLLLVALVTIVGLPLRPYINPTNLVMLYLLAVMLAAVRLGRYPAILASLLSVLAFDFVFVPPYQTFGANDAEYILTYIGLLAVGLVISTLASRAKEQELAARRRERQTAAMFQLSQKIASGTAVEQIVEMVVQHAQETFGTAAAVYLPAENAPDQVALQAATPNYQAEEEGTAVAAWVCRHGQPAGRHTNTLASVKGTYIPLITTEQPVGVLVIDFAATETPLTGEQNRLLLSVASQAALAIERAKLADKARQAHLLAETEKLQTALLNSISHDLRTPLASITGVLSSLYEDDNLLSDEARKELVYTAWQESRRLNRLVGNLLNMTRLESGALKIVRQPSDIQELVGSALAQMGGRLQSHPIHVQIPNDLPLVEMDFTLMVQVLVNILENATKYAPAGTSIYVTAVQTPTELIISIHDEGPGIPEPDLENVFNRFFRGKVGETAGSSGTGLGLSIAKGIVEAHNGRVWAENRPTGGTTFSIALPLSANQPTT